MSHNKENLPGALRPAIILTGVLIAEKRLSLGGGVLYNLRFKI